MLGHCMSMPRMARQHRAGGYTIIELMLTIAVLGVIASFAAPSFLNTIRINRIVTDNNEFVTALTLARSEAIKRGGRVTLCRSSDQATCTGGGWETGWIVFTDPANFGAVDPGEEVLRTWEAASQGTTIRADGGVTGWVSFVASGETRAAGANNGTFRVCGSNADIAQARQIREGLLGYAATSNGTAACP